MVPDQNNTDLTTIHYTPSHTVQTIALTINNHIIRDYPMLLQLHTQYDTYYTWGECDKGTISSTIYNVRIALHKFECSLLGDCHWHTLTKIDTTPNRLSIVADSTVLPNFPLSRWQVARAKLFNFLPTASIVPQVSPNCLKIPQLNFTLELVHSHGVHTHTHTLTHSDQYQQLHKVSMRVCMQHTSFNNTCQTESNLATNHTQRVRDKGFGDL